MAEQPNESKNPRKSGNDIGTNSLILGMILGTTNVSGTCGGKLVTVEPHRLLHGMPLNLLVSAIDNGGSIKV